MPGINFFSAPCNHICFSKKGERPEFTPGDFILVHGKNWYSRLIQFGQSLRFRGQDARFAYWTHTAIIISSNGDMIEALSGGVKLTNIADYDDFLYAHVNIQAGDDDRREAINFASRCVKEQYGWLTILSIAFSMLTGMRISIGIDGQEICSGLVARSLERTNAIFPRDPSHISPADLAKYYEVSQA